MDAMRTAEHGNLEQQHNNYNYYRSHPRSPPRSPTDSRPSLSSLASDGFQQRYPRSQKYEMPLPMGRPMVGQSPQSYASDPVQVAQLRLIVTQLRNSVQVANSNSQRLQQQLFGQRQKVYELVEVKRRLEEELERVQFQFQRIGSYEALQEKEEKIKIDTVLRENSRLSGQVTDLLEENKRLRAEQRKVMTDLETVAAERSCLARENQELERRLEELQREMRSVRVELERKSERVEQSMRMQQKMRMEQNMSEVVKRNQSWKQGQLLQVQTQRSQQQPTVAASLQSIRLPELREEEEEQPSNSGTERDVVDREGEKMLQDYQKLLVENQSMKRLYLQFYKNGRDNSESGSMVQLVGRAEPIQKEKATKVAKGEVQELPRSFSNHLLTEKLSSSRASHEPVAELMQTGQRQQLGLQLAQVRREAVQEAQRCFGRAEGEAKREKSNVLRVFEEEVRGKIEVLGRLAENYLELRESVKEEMGVQLPEKIDNSQFKGEAAAVAQMYQSAKEKAKAEGNAALPVAVFRLLTLLARCRNIPDVLQQHIQHSALKYLYKLSTLPAKS